MPSSRARRPLRRIVTFNGPEVEAGGGGRVRQFMLGGEWMVLPVLRPGADRVCGYFPRGRWLSLWGQETLHVVGAGRWETVASPPGYPAVYVRA